MNITVLGAGGRTGRQVIDELTRRGHAVTAVVRDDSGAGIRPPVRLVVGDVRDLEALDAAIAGADVVVSALGPGRGDTSLHADAAPLIRQSMERHGVRRYIGISGAGLDVAGDRKRLRDRLVSRAMSRTSMVRDKAAEYAVWAASDVEWTLVRPPRLVDGPGAGDVEHAAHTSPRRTSVTRADLAGFVARLVSDGGYERQAPLVAAKD